MKRSSRGLLAVAVTTFLLPPPVAWGQERPLLELSLEDAVKRALENNVDIAVERYGPESSAQSVREAQGFYDPLFSSTLTSSSRTTRAQNVFAGADKVDTDTLLYNFGLSKAFLTGGSLRVDFSNSRQDTNSVFATFNPTYSSNLTASVTQPLLRNFRIDAGRQQLKVARRNKEISDAQFRQTVVNTLSSVRQLYYDLLYAIDNLEAQRKSLALAKKLLEENQIRVRVGTMAPLDVVAAESEVALREEAVIVAEAGLGDAEDALKRSIFPKHEAGLWDLRVVPTDRPTAEPVAVDAEAALRKALEQRTDIVAARKSLENAELSADLARNQTLPGIDLVGSYGASGLGGTQLQRRDPPFGPIVGTIPGGYGDALDQVFGRDFPTWSVGVSVSYPILNRSAKAAAARARVSVDQSRANLQRLEMQIATEIRTAARAVETNLKRVASTRAARVLQTRRLDAEEKKFAAGMSTNFLVTQAQRDLALAEVAELRAIADYRKSLVNFERVQEAGLGGGGGLLSVSTGTSGRSTATSTTSARTGTGQQQSQF